ncbi:helix-turn-helix domain-containing protein [Aeromonas jandaei]|uniref:helix-turn-helix domain-containing protein n=1 Tax=Aeromonas jandaei TaxID=650 RepID=UPI0011178C91|nr:AraC family transcriptional regulator [Aeromonas jandaei]TNI04160.1 AraC family transcriptional regulator [Aeromonas jandaei]
MSFLHRSCLQGHFTPLHSHPQAQYCYMHDGGGVITGGAASELLVAGQLCFIPAGWAHEFRVLRHSRLSLIYTPSLVSAPFGLCQVTPLLAGLFARLSELEEGADREAYLTVIGHELARSAPQAAQPALAANLDPRLLRVLERFCQAPSINTTLAELAVDCGASLRTLNRLFLQQLGCTFRQWREQVVMGGARQLQYQGFTSAQIADLLGYEDPAAFSRALQRFVRRDSAS